VLSSGPPSPGPPSIAKMVGPTTKVTQWPFESQDLPLPQRPSVAVQSAVHIMPAPQYWPAPQVSAEHALPAFAPAAAAGRGLTWLELFFTPQLTAHAAPNNVSATAHNKAFFMACSELKHVSRHWALPHVEPLPLTMCSVDGIDHSICATTRARRPTFSCLTPNSARNASTAACVVNIQAESISESAETSLKLVNVERKCRPAKGQRRARSYRRVRSQSRATMSPCASDARGLGALPFRR
jgi:hypothetical protein